MHVDLYTIDAVGRAYVRVAVVVYDGGQFVVEAPRPEIEKSILVRIEESGTSSLSGLTALFSVPELLASVPHDDADCPFSKSDRLPLELRQPTYRLVDAPYCAGAAESRLAALS